MKDELKIRKLAVRHVGAEPRFVEELSFGAAGSISIWKGTSRRPVPRVVILEEPTGITAVNADLVGLGRLMSAAWSAEASKKAELIRKALPNSYYLIETERDFLQGDVPAAWHPPRFDRDVIEMICNRSVGAPSG